jgi:hypothetical protein
MSGGFTATVSFADARFQSNGVVCIDQAVLVDHVAYLAGQFEEREGSVVYLWWSGLLRHFECHL